MTKLHNLFNITVPEGSVNQAQKSSTPKSIIIGIMNQKGGVGKTTITTLLANLFNFYFNYKVAIVDADMPQHSIIKRRQAEIRQIQEEPKFKNALKKIYTRLLAMENPIHPIDVFPADFKTACNVINEVQSHYDIIFIDMAGTLNQKHLIEVLQQVHHFFIPTFEDVDSMNSSIEFHEILKKYIISADSTDSTENNFKSVHFFFNRVGQMNQIHKLKKQVEERGPLLDEFVYSYKAYERKLRSTVFPIPMQTERNPFNKEANLLLKFAKSIVQIIEYHYVNNKHSNQEVEELLV